MEDNVLLRRFVEERANEAFQSLVERHVNLVYFSALRQTGNAAMAEDVVQEVFTDLARKAPKLVDRPVLAGWLYTSTRYAAANARRSEGRRRVREQEAYAMQEIMHNEEPVTDWGRLRPVIDDALHALSETDREAVLLRFFQGRAFAEIGAALRLTEEAARKRVDRALDKMAAVLAKRGVTSTSVAVGAAMATQATVAAPAGLAASVAGVALTKTIAAGAAASGGVLAWLGSAKATLGLGVVAVAGFATAFNQVNETRRRAAEVRGLTSERQALLARVGDLERRLAAAEQRVSAAEHDTEMLLGAVQHELTAKRGVAAAPLSAAQDAASRREGAVTENEVNARYRKGQELARAGDLEGALREYLWCFDEGMARMSSMLGTRGTFLLADIMRLAERYPAALDALRSRREAAERQVLGGTDDYSVVSALAALNQHLQAEGRTADVLLQLPDESPARKTLATSAFDELVRRQRYTDALLGRSVATMQSHFEASAERETVAAVVPTTEEARVMTEKFQAFRRDRVIKRMAKDIEVLAGTGKFEEARAFVNKLLAYDNTDATRRQIEEHLARAGRGGWRILGDA